MSLSVLPVRNDGESAIGYLSRLAQTYGLSTTDRMTAEFGLRLFEVAAGKGFDILASETRCSKDGLRFDTGMPTSKIVELRGQSLYRRQWSVSGQKKVCPACFDEDRRFQEKVRRRLPRAWHRTWWDVKAVTACVRHRVLVVDRCPICGSSLNWHQPAVDRCPHGHLLTGSQRLPDDRDLSASTYIVGRLGAAEPLRCDILDKVSLGDAIEALETLGSLCVGDTLEQRLSAAFSVFRDWPHPFAAFLDRRLFETQPTLGRWGAAARYGDLYERLINLRRNPIGVEMRKSLAEHAALNGVVTGTKTAFGHQPSSDWVSLSDARRALGSGFEVAKRSAGELGLLPAQTKRGTPILLKREVVQALVDQRRAMIGAVDLSRQFGVGRVQAREIVKAELIKAVPGGGLRRFRPEDVENLVTDLRCGASILSQPPDGAAFLNGACRVVGCPISTAIRAIHSGRLRAVGYDPEKTGLAALVIVVRQLREFVKSDRQMFTVADTAAKIGVKWAVAKQLIDAGLISARGKFVPSSAIDRFQLTYISGSAIATTMKIRPQSFLQMTRALDIKPAIAPPDCRQVFFLRSDLDNHPEFESATRVPYLAKENGMTVCC